MGRLEQRKRNSEKRRIKSIIVIGCEGKNKTETIYFRNFCSRECIIKFSTGKHTDPVGIANDLIEFIRREDIKAEYGDKIYLLFDTDINQNKQSQIEEAKNICKQNNIKLITSTPTFEYWYILHFKNTAKRYQSSKQVKEELKTIINGYTENMNVYPVLEDKMLKAIHNAKIVEKNHIINKKDIDNEESNPHSSVYKVVEEITKRKT